MDSTIEQESLKRKQKLQEIRAAKESKDKGQTLNFRNYQPLTEEITTSSQILETGNAENIRQEIKQVEETVKQFAKDAIDTELNKSKEIDLLNLAPKKPNWDLKRELEKKMEPLVVKTNQAISDLIRQRLKNERNISDFNASDFDRTVAHKE